MANRVGIEIMAQVLEFCAQPRLKTHVMYNVNITFQQFETYALFLSSQKLLTHNSDRYVTTEKGHKFVRAFNELQSILEDIPLDALSAGPIPRIKSTANFARHVAKGNTSVPRLVKPIRTGPSSPLRASQIWFSPP